MGQLRRDDDGTTVPLRSNTLIGRSRRSDLSIDDGEVSAQHARVRWSDGAWLLEDLGSRNGTYVDGDRLHPPERVRLQPGMKLAFGHVATRWTVADIGAPRIEAVPIDGGKAVAAVNGVLFVGFDADTVTITQAEGNWELREPSGAVRTVRDQEQVEVAGRRWLLHLPEGWAPF